MAMERTPMTSRDVLWVVLPISPNPGPALAQDVPPRGPGAPFRYGQGTPPARPPPGRPCGRPRPPRGVPTGSWGPGGGGSPRPQRHFPIFRLLGRVPPLMSSVIFAKEGQPRGLHRDKEQVV
jgi:hypothetical protein